MEPELNRLFEALKLIDDESIPAKYKFVIGVWYDRNDFDENSLSILIQYHQKRNEIQLTDKMDMLCFYNLVARNFGEVDRILGISNKYPQVSFAEYFTESLQSEKSPPEMQSQGLMEYNQEIQQPGQVEEYKHHIQQSKHSRIQDIDQSNIYQHGHQDQPYHYSSIPGGDYVGQDLKPGSVTRYTSGSDHQEEQMIINQDQRQPHNLAAPLNIPYIPTPQGPPQDQGLNSSRQDKSIEIIDKAVALESLELSRLKEIFNISRPRIYPHIEEASPKPELTQFKEDKSYLDRKLRPGVEDTSRKDVKHRESDQDRVIKDVDQPRKIQNKMLYHCETCSVDSSIEGMIRLKECGHYYHIECIRSTALRILSNRCIPSACPGRSCGSKIDSDEILTILPSEYHERYSELVAISLSPGQYECPKCSHLFSKSRYQTYIRCPKCITYICEKCKLQEHIGKTCIQASKLNQLKDDTRADERSHQRRKCLYCDLENHPQYTCQDFRKYKYG